jgi:protein N-terminal amidase
VDEMLRELNYEFDILLLPEMAFSGYMFDSKEEVEPFTEKCGEGLTFQWCANTAREYNCMVVAGYPEKSDDKFYNR